MKRKLLGFGLFALLFAVFCVFYLDQPLALWLRTIEIQRYYRIYRTLTDAGEAAFYFAVGVFGLVSAWLALRLFPDLSLQSQRRLRSFKEGCIFLLLAMLTSGLVLHLLKFLFGRQRPHATEDFQAHVFHPFNTHWHYHSMPSGHSQTLLAVATVIWMIFPRSGWVVFPLALVLALTRLAMQAHFLSDVTVGAYVGFAVTFWVAQRLGRLSLGS